jgi:adenylate kinase
MLSVSRIVRVVAKQSSLVARSGASAAPPSLFKSFGACKSTTRWSSTGTGATGIDTSSSSAPSGSDTGGAGGASGAESKFTAEELKQLRQSFTRVDADHDGHIGRVDFQKLLAETGEPAESGKIKELFDKHDSNGDGRLDFGEFLTLIEHVRDERSKDFTTRFSTYLRSVLLSAGPSEEAPDAALLFARAWDNVLKRYGEENLRFPKELIFLGGAPGAGKGTNTPFILQTRGLSAAPVIMSELLDEFPEIKSSGALVSDAIVTELLLERLLEARYRNGVIIDGFPRTESQVECLQMLREKMSELRQKFSHSPIGRQYPRPRFIVAILYVDEQESVRRQLARGQKAREHNRRVKERGYGELHPVRDTDMSEDIARHRYAVFLKHYQTIQKLRKHFTFTVINATGTVQDVETRIKREFAYQSSTELSTVAFEAICDIPTASEAQANARQLLVARIEEYVTNNQALFMRVVAYVAHYFVEAITNNAIGGETWVRADASLFGAPVAQQMAIDLLSERGYFAIVRQDMCDKDVVTFRVTWPPLPMRKHAQE